MQKNVHSDLGKRTRQVLDVLYRRGSLTASELQEALPELPSYSAARAVLRRLEELGLATHDRQGTRYIYRPAVPHEEARTSALQNVIETFFAGSPTQAMQALVSLGGSRLNAEELAELKRLITEAEHNADDREEPGGHRK